MRELSTIEDKPLPPLPRQSRSSKRWIIAVARKNYQLETMQNAAAEKEYHRIINIVKSQYLQPNEVYFERDYKTDKSEGLFGMHSFLTPTFYWRLDCSFVFEYGITLAFNNCPFEQEIRKRLRAYPLDRAVKVIALQPDFGTYYRNVLRIQDPCFLHSL